MFRFSQFLIPLALCLAFAGRLSALQNTLLPVATEARVAAYAASPEAEILSNTPELQAVRAGRCLLAVFYQLGRMTVAPGQELAVDQPCLVLVDESKDQLVVTIADPTRQAQEVRVTLGGRTVPVKMPAGPMAGSSVSHVWK